MTTSWVRRHGQAPGVGSSQRLEEPCLGQRVLGGSELQTDDSLMRPLRQTGPDRELALQAGGRETCPNMTPALNIQGAHSTPEITPEITQTLRVSGHH